MCQDTLNKYCDVTLADPWLRQFSEEKIGKTLVVCNTDAGNTLLRQCADEKNLILDDIDHSEVIKSQKGTILRKKSYLVAPNICKYYRVVLKNKAYRNVVCTPTLFQLHCKLKKLVERYLLYKQKHSK